jgi:hypothetical protein
MFTWSETPLVDLWGQLRYLASSANVYDLLSGQLGIQRQLGSQSLPLYNKSDALKARAHEIASCIRQADEYYRSSDSVSLATQPLLQFYGAESLAKAVILANVPDSQLSDMNYHGLSTNPNVAKDNVEELKAYSSNPNSWEVEKQFAITNKGVFPLLCKSVGDTLPPEGTVFFFKELLSTIPDMATRYAHFQETSHCFYLSGYPEYNQDKKLHVSFSPREKLSKVIKVFPEFENDFEQTGDGFLSRSTMNGYPPFLCLQEGTVAGIYLVRPVAGGIYHSFPILFATLFILSNIVRYKPAFWMKVIEGQSTGIISIVEAFCSIAKRRLPNDVLDAIWNEKFKYGTPGYWT